MKSINQKSKITLIVTYAVMVSGLIALATVVSIAATNSRYEEKVFPEKNSIIPAKKETKQEISKPEVTTSPPARAPNNQPTPTSKPAVASARLAPAPAQPQPTPAAPMPDNSEYGNFDNMCANQGNGNYTTVIISNYDPNERSLFPYYGPLDPATRTPLTAAGSQQWCRDNDPWKV